MLRLQVSISFFLLIFLSSCGANQTVRDSRKTLKGNWTLTDINYSRDGIYKVTLFNDVSSECMVGSSWQFIPNNNFGNYQLDSSSGCEEGIRYFIWSIPDNDGESDNYDILIKPTDEKKKSIANNAGFRVNLAYLSDSNLTMTQTVSEGGSPFKITMNFTKNNNDE